MPDKKKFLLRLPPDLWNDLIRWAETDLRSVNGQIEYILREAVKRRTGHDDKPSTNPKQSKRRR